MSAKKRSSCSIQRSSPAPLPKPARPGRSPCLCASVVDVSSCHLACSRHPNILLIMADDMGFSDLARCGSESLLPVLKGGTRDGHEAIYWEHMGNRAVRKGNWKLVSTSKGRWELYDIEADRTELDDLAAKRPDVAGELLGLYTSWAARCGVRERPKKRGR